MMYDCGRASPFNRYFEGLSETVDPKTGALIMRQKDLTLPAWSALAGSDPFWSWWSPAIWEEGRQYRWAFRGRIWWGEQPVSYGAIDAYFSGEARLMRWEPDTWSWTCMLREQLECVMMPIPAPEGSIVVDEASASVELDTHATYLDHKYGIGLGWAFAFPSVEVRSDGRFLHLGDGRVYRVSFRAGTPSNLADYKLRDLVFARKTASCPGAECGSAYCLTAKDGTETYFASDGRLLWTEDRFGNTMVFRYQKVGEWRRIAQIVDSLGRVVRFTYGQSSATMSVQGKTWVYAFGSLPASEPDEAKAVLTSVADPLGRTTRYDYSAFQASFRVVVEGLSISASGHNLYANLTRVTHPTGGSSSYAYGGSWKNMTRDNPWETDKCTMTVSCVINRRDKLSMYTAVNESEFRYFRENPSDPAKRRYGMIRTQVPAVSGECSHSCVEKWAYTSKHLLASHSLKDAAMGDAKETVYQYNEAKLVTSESIAEALAGTNSNVTVASMNYEWDAYGNLRSVDNALTGAKTEYEYDPRYHLVMCTAEKADASGGSPAAWRYTINALDDTGRKVISSSQSMQKPEWHAKPPLTAPVSCRLVNIGDVWRSWTAGPAGGAQLNIDWVRGPFQVVGYEISYRRNEDSQWVTVPSRWHGWFEPFKGTDRVPINFPEPGVYSIRVRMNLGLFKWTYATIVSTTEQPYERVFPAQTMAKSMVKYSYGDLGYPGNVTQITVAQPGGQDEITSFAYDSVGHAYPVSMSTSIAAANGVASTVAMEAEYDLFGRVTKYTTRSGSSSSTKPFDYGEIGRLVKATYPSGDGPAATREWRWNDVDRTVARIDEEGRSLIEQYDQLGRFAELRRPAAPPNLAAAVIARVGYNSLGGIAYEEDAAGRQTSYEYDGFGRRIRTVHPDGSFETALFEVCQGDPSGAVSVETRVDALGRRAKTYLDAAGRKVRVEQEAENGLSAATRFEYDLLGRITRMVDPAGQETLYSCSTQTPSGTIYGYWDSPLEVDLPGDAEPVHKYVYDSCGRTIQSDGNANSYDELGRLKRATYPDRTYATFYYDKNNRLTEARLFGTDGKPVCKTGAEYDARGRKTGEWWDVWGTRYSIGYEYNKADDVVRMTFPDGASVEYVYDGWGRLLAIPSLFGTGAFDPGFSYAQSGALSRIGRTNIVDPGVWTLQRGEIR